MVELMARAALRAIATAISRMGSIRTRPKCFVEPCEQRFKRSKRSLADVPPLFELTLVLRLVRMAVARQNLHSIFDIQLIRSLHDCAVSCQFEPRTAPRCRVRRFVACGWGTATSYHSWGWFG